jgi:hypothetical protein
MEASGASGFLNSNGARACVIRREVLEICNLSKQQLEAPVNNDFVEVRGVSLPRRMVLQGVASLLGCAFAPDALYAAAQSCALTPSDILGPFYRFGAPFQTKLAGPRESGERLIISGKIYSSDCRSHLPNTLIEVWQADSAGKYDTKKPGNFTERLLKFGRRTVLESTILKSLVTSRNA